MVERATRDFKLKGVAAIAAIVASSLALIGGWFALGQLLPLRSGSLPETVRTSPPDSVEIPKSAVVSSSSPESFVAQVPASNPRVTANTPRQGLLRVGNLSEHPVRVALLLKKSGQSKDVAGSQASYEPPAHWDFAPGEGQAKGLVLSLPSRSLQLKPGDILVAFAQDGSRRYWGPYVVGETSSPSWSPDASEWQLALEP
jgi:hypothetical protein